MSVLKAIEESVKRLHAAGEGMRDEQAPAHGDRSRGLSFLKKRKHQLIALKLWPKQSLASLLQLIFV